MHKPLAFLASIGLLYACSSTNNDTAGTSPASTGGASSVQVDQCKQSCDKMKFFACNSAEEQAACYADCGKASADQIQLFNACAENSICDPACRTNIVPKPAAGGEPKGTGATPTTCSTACSKLVSCSFIKVGDQKACESQCATEAYQYQIDCINGTECGNIQKACGGDTGGGTVVVEGDAGDLTVGQCQQACDQLLFFSCISAADQSTCRDTCTTTTKAKRETFDACAQAAGGECTNATACYTTFKK